MTANQRIWSKLPEPPPGHPDETLLWEAEQALHTIAKLADRPDIRNVFARRLDEYSSELVKTAGLVRQTEHNIAFIGDIGVGKTTALCRVVGLEMSRTPGATTSVLETGQGGTTICEVRIVNGSDYGIVVEPRSESELQREVRELAHFVTPSSESRQDGETGASRGTGVSREVERAIRNMSGLIPGKPQQNEGTHVPAIDPARVLAAELDDENNLAAEIWNRIGIQNRTRRELWYADAAQSDADPLRWLNGNFRHVNNGRHPEFSLPRRIDVTVPSRILGAESLSIRIVDTKGIDGVAERADLESYLNEPNTIAVLCTSFNNAPAVSVQQLLERAMKAGFPDLETKSAVLVLPHPGAALGMKDYAGDPVDEVWEGYDLKRAQAELQLSTSNLPKSRIEFFNAKEDDVQRFSGFLLDLVAGLRKTHHDRLEEVILGAMELVENYENEQARAVQQQAARRLTIWLENNRQVGPFSEPVHASLFQAIGRAYASSLRASVRRNGDWPNLNYEHHLGYGARAMTADVVALKANEFRAVATNLLQDAEMEDAFQLVRQASRIFTSGTEILLEAAKSLGEEAHTEYMEPDNPFWDRCDHEWGRGPGYKNRVTGHHLVWFGAHPETETVIAELVAEEWQKILDRVAAILADEDDA